MTDSTDRGDRTPPRTVLVTTGMEGPQHDRTARRTIQLETGLAMTFACTRPRIVQDLEPDLDRFC